MPLLLRRGHALPEQREKVIIGYACLFSYLQDEEHKKIMLDTLRGGIRDYEDALLDNHMSVKELTNNVSFGKWFAVLLRKIKKRGRSCLD